MFSYLLTLILSFAQDPYIVDGYSYPLSVLPGDSVSVYLNASEKVNNFPLKLYDLSGKQVALYRAKVYPQNQVGEKPWETGFGYKANLKIILPKLKSGVYVWDNKIPLIVRSTNPKMVVVYSSNTENAYCPSGGKSLYNHNSTNREPSPTLSFKRPIALPRYSEAFLRWFHTQDFNNVGYITDGDLDYYDYYKKADLLMIVGHSEYWTREARVNFDRFVNDGKNAIIMSGNTMWWQVKYSKNRERMTCTREEGFRVPVEPITPKSIAYSIGVEFSRAGYGTKFNTTSDKGWDGYKIITQSPLLAGTNLKIGSILELPTTECDGAPIIGADSRGYPIVDNKSLGFDKIEIIGFDSVFRANHGISTWVVFKKSKKTGIVINTASTDWCSSVGMDNANVQRITTNMITRIMRKENVFSTN
jgi:hypothetical protein